MIAPTLPPTALHILQVLRELVREDPGALKSCYGIDIRNPDDCPLDQAVVEWVEAGMPMPAVEGEP